MHTGTGDPVWRSDPSSTPVAVIAALELEGRIAAPAVAQDSAALFVSGPGGPRARDAARQAIAAGARGLVSFGLAGGLVPEAAPVSLLLPEKGCSERFAWQADKAWRERIAFALETACTPITGSLFSADRVLTSVRDKQDAARVSGAIAVDMESASIAEAAVDANLPFLAIRVVADGADDSLPANAASLVTPDGRTRFAGLAGFAVAPLQLPLLFRLAQRSGAARRQLERVVAALMRTC